MDFDLGSFITGCIIGFLIIPLWKFTKQMCNGVERQYRNKKKDKKIRNRGFPYKNRDIRKNETKN